VVLSNNKFEILFSCRSFRSSFFLYGNVSSNAANARSAGNPLSSIATSTTASSDKQRANKILVAGFAPPLFFKFATTRVLINSGTEQTWCDGASDTSECSRKYRAESCSVQAFGKLQLSHVEEFLEVGGLH